MKFRPIHENLDTSFVNVSALIRYLRHRHFVGRVSIVLNGYEAEVLFLDGNKLRVSEHDRIAGRIAEGEEALQRLLVRSRDPGGIVNVHQAITDTQKADSTLVQQPIAETVEMKPVVTEIPKPIEVAAVATVSAPAAEVEPYMQPEFVPQAPSLPNFPFNLSNKVESKAKQMAVSPQEWQILVQLTGEILRTIDASLASAKLDFPTALVKVQTEICEDYPFLHPKLGGFSYTASRILMKEQINSKIFVASQNEIVRRILNKLKTNEKFSDTYRTTHQQLVTLFGERKPHYDRFSITPQLAKTLQVS
jgi:hypothetical protein